MNFDDLLEICRNENGDYYFIYKVEAPRAINPKAKRKAREVIIVGVPKAKLVSYLKGVSND